MFPICRFPATTALNLIARGAPQVGLFVFLRLEHPFRLLLLKSCAAVLNARTAFCLDNNAAERMKCEDTAVADECDCIYDDERTAMFPRSPDFPRECNACVADTRNLRWCITGEVVCL